MSACYVQVSNRCIKILTTILINTPNTSETRSKLFLVIRMSSQVLNQILAIFFTFVLVHGQGFHPAGFIPQECLDCICMASSDCQEDIGCNNVGHGKYFCGPYHISYAYWQDGGSPGANPDDPLDFEKCLNYKPCAEASIKGYMSKWSRDCDDNQTVDCFDIALIHKSGPNGCNDTWVLGTEYWSKFKECYSKIPVYD